MVTKVLRVYSQIFPQKRKSEARRCTLQNPDDTDTGAAFGVLVQQPRPPVVCQSSDDGTLEQEEAACWDEHQQDDHDDEEEVYYSTNRRSNNTDAENNGATSKNPHNNNNYSSAGGTSNDASATEEFFLTCNDSANTDNVAGTERTIAQQLTTSDSISYANNNSLLSGGGDTAAADLVTSTSSLAEDTSHQQGIVTNGMFQYTYPSNMNISTDNNYVAQQITTSDSISYANNNSLLSGGEDTAAADLVTSTSSLAEDTSHQQGIVTNGMFPSNMNISTDNNYVSYSRSTMDADVDNAANSLLVMLSSTAEASNDSGHPGTITNWREERTRKIIEDYNNIHNLDNHREDTVGVLGNARDSYPTSTKPQNVLIGGNDHHVGEGNDHHSAVVPSYYTEHEHGSSGVIVEQQTTGLTPDTQNNIHISGNLAPSHLHHSLHLPRPYQQDRPAYFSEASQHDRNQYSNTTSHEASTDFSSKENKTHHSSICEHCSKCKHFFANDNKMLHEAIDTIFQRQLDRSRRRIEDAKDAERRMSAQGYEEVTAEQNEAILSHGAAYGAIELPIPTKFSYPMNTLQNVVCRSVASKKWAKVESRRKKEKEDVRIEDDNSDCVDGSDPPPNKRRKKVMTVNDKIIAVTMGSHIAQKDISRFQNFCFCDNCRKLTDEVNFLEILKKMFINSYRLDPPSRYPNEGYLPIEKEHRDAIISNGEKYGVDFPITTKLRHAAGF